MNVNQSNVFNASAEPRLLRPIQNGFVKIYFKKYRVYWEHTVNPVKATNALSRSQSLHIVQPISATVSSSHVAFKK